MAQFRVPTRNDRFGFVMSIDARITEFRLSSTADLVGSLILSGVDPADANEFKNVDSLTVIADWLDFGEARSYYALTAIVSSESGLCATLSVQVPAADRLQLEMKAAIMEEWNEVTVTKLREFGFSEPWI